MKKRVVAVLVCLLLLCFACASFVACNIGSCIIQFDTLGGSNLGMREVKKGNKIVFSSDWYKEPTMSGYIFKGWRYEDGEAFDENDTFNENTTLYAVWEKNQYKVTLKSNILNAGELTSYKTDNTTETSDEYDYEESVTVSASVFKGYDFMGWFDEEGNVCTHKKTYSFTVPAEEIELTAEYRLQDAFTDWKFRSTETELTITGYNGDWSIVTVPEGTTAIGKEAFDKSSNADVMYITDIIIPTGVKSIGESAFADCYDLCRISIPDSVSSIGAYAFSGCKKLESVKIPVGVTAIENGTFYNCPKLSSVTIPNTVTSIGTNAFYLCNGLQNITIPSSVSTIKRGAFYMCGNSNAPITIKCEATSEPAGWADKWYEMCGRATVEWGVISDSN